MTPSPKESDDSGPDGITTFARPWTLMCNGFKFVTGQFHFPLGGLGGLFRVVHGPVYVAAVHHSLLYGDSNFSVAKFVLDLTSRGLTSLVEKKHTFEDCIFEAGQVGFISPGWLPLCVGLTSTRSVLTWQPVLSKWNFKKCLGGAADDFIDAMKSSIKPLVDSDDQWKVVGHAVGWLGDPAISSDAGGSE